jgi:hypothetical protein
MSDNAFLPSTPVPTVVLTLSAERLLLSVKLGELEIRLGMGDGARQREEAGPKAVTDGGRFSPA